jgi:hypothetical protein
MRDGETAVTDHVLEFAGRTADSRATNGRDDSEFNSDQFLASISFIMCVCLSAHPSALNNLVANERIFEKFNIWVFFENLLKKKLIFSNMWQE